MLTFCKRGSLNKRAAHLDHYNVLHIALFWCKQQWAEECRLVQGVVIMHREGYIVKMHTVALMQRSSG